MNTCICGHEFETKLAPCPDGRDGCCVAHYNKDSFVCPSCGEDLGPAIGKAIREGRVEYVVGLAIINVAAVASLDFYTTDPKVQILVASIGELMEKYGVEYSDEKNKTASTQVVHCPLCGQETEKDGDTYLKKCPIHGTEPWEKK